MNTKAEPSIVPNSGIRSPMIIVAVISVIVFYLLVMMQRYNLVVSRAIPISDDSLLFVQFNRQSVGVAEEHKLLAGPTLLYRNT